MQLFYTDVFVLPLPPGHRFPMAKYSLLRDRVVAELPQVRQLVDDVREPVDALGVREEVERIYDQRFVRMWEFYLAASEMSFREQNLMVMQIQLTKRQDVVPMTRDYIARETARLRSIERSQRAPLRIAGE